jgi:hypothetical protein
MPQGAPRGCVTAAGAAAAGAHPAPHAPGTGPGPRAHPGASGGGGGPQHVGRRRHGSPRRRRAGAAGGPHGWPPAGHGPGAGAAADDTRPPRGGRAGVCHAPSVLPADRVLPPDRGLRGRHGPRQGGDRAGPGGRARGEHGAGHPSRGQSTPGGHLAGRQGCGDVAQVAAHTKPTDLAAPDQRMAARRGKNRALMALGHPSVGIV